MSDDITKLCADSLRAFAENKYGVKLKSSHAHELVAGFFGYKSKAALLADSQHPLSNLRQAEFIVFDPSTTDFVSQRLLDFGYGHRLFDFGYGEPKAYPLADCFRATLKAEKWFAEKNFLTFREVAIHIAEQRLHQRLKMLGINPASFEWNIDGNMMYWRDKGVAYLEAGVSYPTNSSEPLWYSKYTIHVSRVAVNIGYGNPEVVEHLFSGEARKNAFHENNPFMRVLP